MTRQSWKICFAISEAFPFIKVGGLADVGGALPKHLARLGHEVRLLLPGCPVTVGPGQQVLTLDIPLGPALERVTIRAHGEHAGVALYTVANERYLDGQLAYGYTDSEHTILPFLLFSQAVIAFAAQGDWRPDIIHLHDWHLGLASWYARHGPHRAALARTGIVFTIHNLAYQGQLRPAALALAGLPAGASGQESLLAWGIATADTVNTVSRRYREEILTPAGGMGLDALLRSRADSLYGVLNGVDYETFDPRADSRIVASYDGTFLDGKGRNKVALQARSGLAPDPARPLLGMVARLVEQKGVDLLCAALDDIAALGVQVVVMGLGDERYQRALLAAAKRNAGAVAYHATDEEVLARQVYAGSDFFLAPSTFEPCGLAPLIALRYGTIPIVRRTGGLAETIRDCREDAATGLGFTFVERSPRELVATVRAGLELYRERERWQALQRRAMTADFSWERASREYARLYQRTLARRRGGAAPPVPARRTVPLALVHHANQYLIANGYENREGLAELVAGYATTLLLHERYGVSVNLHLSGTLLEAIAWHCPWFLELLRDLRGAGVVELIGGTYAENIMPLFSPDFNRRQLDELLWLYERHLHCPPDQVRVCWVPERVWNTALLAPVLTDPSLANGGYRAVLLDDRLLYPVGAAYPESPRARFDAAMPYSAADRAPASQDASLGGEFDLAETSRARRIAGGRGLVLAPISAALRYRAPPRSAADWRYLETAIAALLEEGSAETVLVYADDLEKAAGVGPWTADNVERYAAFLRWVASQRDLEPVRLSGWLDAHTVATERVVEPGTYFELAQTWGAGEEYRAWSMGEAWRPYAGLLERARETLDAAAREGAECRLLALAWKHLLACTYETAWHEATPAGRAPALWSRALASHARACLPIVAAARWFALDESARGPAVEVTDLDGDGVDEVILRAPRTYAVLSPAYGGRLVALFTLTAAGGAMVVGNPTDDWNWQEELHRYMDQPANHPGALTEVGFEHDRYKVAVARQDAGSALVELVNVEGGSPLCGTRKRLLLLADGPELVVRYELPTGRDELAVDSCLSPDYYRLLREGCAGLFLQGEQSWRGYRQADGAGLLVWLALASDEETSWAEPRQAVVGHGLTLRTVARGRRFHLLAGCGDTDDERCQWLLARSRVIIEQVGQTSTAAPVLTGQAAPSAPTSRASAAVGKRTVRRLIGYLAEHRLRLVALFAAMLATSGVEMLSPWPLKFIVDHVIGGRPFFSVDMSESRELVLTLAALAYVLFASLRGYLGFVRRRGLAEISQRTSLTLRADLYAQIQRLSLRFHERAKVGDTVTRVTGDVDKLQEAFVEGVSLLSVELLTVVGVVAVMVLVDWRFTLVALLVLAPLGAIYALFRSRIKEASRAARSGEGAVASLAQETLVSIRVVKAFGQEGREQRRFLDWARAATEASIRAARWEGLFSFGVEVVTASGIAVVLGYGGWRVLRGDLTLGLLLLFMQYLTTLYTPLRRLSRLTGLVQKAAASAERVDELFAALPEVRETPGAVPLRRARGALVFEGVWFGYDPERPVLKGIDFSVDVGQVVAIVGASGAGKSSLAGLIPRFYDPTRGRIRIDGYDLREVRLRSLREQIAMVLQDTILLSGSVRDNIAYGCPEATDREVVAAARAAGAHAFIVGLPDGYETILGERGVGLSGGQRQRIAIARALLRDAPILILDEPTTGLDARSEAAVWTALERLMTGRTTLLIAHKLHLAERADLILVLDDGRIVERGRHDELLRQGGVYARLYATQAGSTMAVEPATPAGRADAASGPVDPATPAITVHVTRVWPEPEAAPLVATTRGGDRGRRPSGAAKALIVMLVGALAFGGSLVAASRYGDGPTAGSGPPGTATSQPGAAANAVLSTPAPQVTTTVAARRVATLTEHRAAVYTVLWSPDGRLLASASEDHTVRLWNTANQLQATLVGHTGAVRTISWAPDSRRLASGSYDGTVRLWSAAGQPLAALSGHRALVTAVAWSPDGQLLASSSADGTLRVWGEDGRLLLVLEGHAASVETLAWSSDGQTLASGSADQTARLWHVAAPFGWSATSGHRGSPDDPTRVAAQPPDVLAGHTGTVWNVAWSPDGRLLASASADGTIRLWNAAGGLQAMLTGHTALVSRVLWSPDGRTLASGSWDGAVRLWAPDGRLLVVLTSAGSPVRNLAWSPDGRTLASTSTDGTVWLWSTDGRSLATLTGHEGDVWSVAWSPDGRDLATASQDRTIGVWR